MSTVYAESVAALASLFRAIADANGAIDPDEAARQVAYYIARGEIPGLRQSPAPQKDNAHE